MASDGPLDGVWCVVSVQMPDVFGQLRTVLISFVSERLEMIVVPKLERRFREANIGLTLVLTFDLSVVNDVWRQALPLEGAEVLVSAVARFVSGFLVFFQSLLVVGFDDSVDVWHAAVADLECVPVEDAIEF